MNDEKKEIKIIKINMMDVYTSDQLYDAFNEAFGFVDWFGRNFNALADCLFTFYFQEESLCKIFNENDSETILEIRMKAGNEEILIYLINLLGYVNLKLSETDILGRISLRPIID